MMMMMAGKMFCTRFLLLIFVQVLMRNMKKKGLDCLLCFEAVVKTLKSLMSMMPLLVMKTHRKQFDC